MSDNRNDDGQRGFWVIHILYFVIVIFVLVVDFTPQPEWSEKIYTLTQGDRMHIRNTVTGETTEFEPIYDGDTIAYIDNENSAITNSSPMPGDDIFEMIDGVELRWLDNRRALGVRLRSDWVVRD